jgi:hypothetical protein
MLTSAVQNHLIDFSAQLLERHLITANQERDACNDRNSAYSRAATLVGLVRTKVEQNPKCYRAFIEALEYDQDANRDILTQLKSKYRSLSGGEQIPFSSCNSCLCSKMIDLCFMPIDNFFLVPYYGTHDSLVFVYLFNRPRISEADYDQPSASANGSCIYCYYWYIHYT